MRTESRQDLHGHLVQRRRRSRVGPTRKPLQTWMEFVFLLSSGADGSCDGGSTPAVRSRALVSRGGHSLTRRHASRYLPPPIFFTRLGDGCMLRRAQSGRHPIRRYCTLPKRSHAVFLPRQAQEVPAQHEKLVLLLYALILSRAEGGGLCAAHYIIGRCSQGPLCPGPSSICTVLSCTIMAVAASIMGRLCAESQREHGRKVKPPLAAPGHAHKAGIASPVFFSTPRTAAERDGCANARRWTSRWEGLQLWRCRINLESHIVLLEDSSPNLDLFVQDYRRSTFCKTHTSQAHFLSFCHSITASTASPPALRCSVLFCSLRSLSESFAV